jgi:hypothetical protein
MKPLKPFSPVSDFQVEGDLKIEGSKWIFSFHLRDSQSVLREGPVDGEWTNWPRADELWKTTCFEAFFGVAGDSKYWELNLSPSKKSWNLYKFEDYRSPQPPTPSKDFELIKVLATSSTLEAEFNSKLNWKSVEASLAVVVRTETATHYFALAHAGPKPDFHLRKSFILKM